MIERRTCSAVAVPALVVAGAAAGDTEDSCRRPRLLPLSCTGGQHMSSERSLLRRLLLIVIIAAACLPRSPALLADGAAGPPTNCHEHILPLH